VGEALDAAKRHDEAFNAKDPDARRAAEASEIEAILPGGMRLRGPDQTLQASQAFWEAIPDAELVWEHSFEAGAEVAIEGHLRGTHTGPFRTPGGEIPPSGKEINLRYATIKRIENGRVASDRVYFDQMEFLQQIGAMPPGD
jgi:steroid delta-isomerase-like uncharacterized protein